MSFSKHRKKFVSSGRSPPGRCWKLNTGSGMVCKEACSGNGGNEGAAMVGSGVKRDEGIVLPVGKEDVVVELRDGKGGNGWFC